MMNNNLYYTAGRIYQLGGRAVPIEGSCVIGKVIISRSSFLSVAARAALPHSLLVSRMMKQNYIDSLDNLSVAFFDIETSSDDKGNDIFVLGCINGKIYNDAKSLLEELLKYQVIVGFNSFRFDYEVLFRAFPSYFQTIKYGRFDLHVLPYRVNIDALFFYQVWRPWNRTHKLDTLFGELGISRLYTLDDKEEKCKEDTMVLERFYVHIKKLFSFFARFGFDHLSYSSLPEAHFSKLRRWCMQAWMIYRGIFPMLMTRDHSVHASFYRSCHRGYFENVNNFDVRSAYPTTAINIGSSLYENGDFAAYQEWLGIQRAEDSDISDCVKWIQNASIGDLGSSASLIYDRKVMVDVWNTFRTVMEQWIIKMRKKNVIYSYTDNVMTCLDSVPIVPGYVVSLKKSFKWLYVYNIERILGVMDNGEVFRYHFGKSLPGLKMWHSVDHAIDNILLGKNFMSFLINPKIDLSGLPLDAFKIVIRKDSEYCRQIDYLMFWEKLKIGFNDVYLSKGGVSDNPNDIDIKQYYQKVDKYLKLYKVRKTKRVLRITV